MVGVTKIQRGNAGYWISAVQQGKEDYYTKPGEAPGEVGFTEVAVNEDDSLAELRIGHSKVQRDRCLALALQPAGDGDAHGFHGVGSDDE